MVPPYRVEKEFIKAMENSGLTGSSPIVKYRKSIGEYLRDENGVPYTHNVTEWRIIQGRQGEFGRSDYVKVIDRILKNIYATEMGPDDKRKLRKDLINIINKIFGATIYP